MSKKNTITHTSHFCQKCNPLIENLVKAINQKTDVDKSLKTDICDELQLLEVSSDDQICECRRALCIVLQAVNMKKWLKLLFSDHESKFHKYSIRIPLPYVQLKTQIIELVNNLQMKMINTIHENRQEEGVKKLKKKKMIRKSKPNRLSQVKKQTYHQQELINYDYKLEEEGDQEKYIKMEDRHDK